MITFGSKGTEWENGLLRSEVMTAGQGIICVDVLVFLHLSFRDSFKVSR